MKVSLADVELRTRLMQTRRIREKRWRDELRPDFGYEPSWRQRMDALWDAIELERAALHPSRREFLLPEGAVEKVLVR